MGHSYTHRTLEDRCQIDRQPPGHWEADLMVFRLYGQAILTLHARHSRLLLAARPPGQAAAPSAHLLAALLAPLPPAWRQTMTFDNGTEFAPHHTLHAVATLSDEHFTHLVQVYNNTPCQCLGYQTPAEVFRNHLLPFKCESTSSRAQA